MRPNEILDLTSTRSGERLNLKGEVIVSFFNELDTGKELCSRFQVRSQVESPVSVVGKSPCGQVDCLKELELNSKTENA
jgi:hypothetical protein